MIKAAIFDMDGLLIDSEPFWRKAEIAVFANHGLQLTENDCRKTMGMRIDEVVAHWYNLHPNLALNQKQIIDEIIATMVELITADGRPMPGALHTLELCKQHGFSFALASSSLEIIINTTLKKLNIAHYFETVQSAEHLEFGKPHPAIFMKTAQVLGVEPEACVVFEDAFHGVVAALAAKCKVVAVPDATQVNQPRFQAADAVLNSLEKFELKLLTDITRSQ